ncbi:NK-tumor recognition protein-like isoform X1, partial [Argonauta hians]
AILKLFHDARETFLSMTVNGTYRPRCFFDVETNGRKLGRIVVELFSDICPKTCENFRALCTGEKGLGQKTGKPLHYKGIIFHRVVKDFMIQGGDFTKGDGTGGESIYGGVFPDENFILKHDQKHLLSMANRGKDTNGSQFFITTRNSPHLDGVHVVFGRVINGTDVVSQIENEKTNSQSSPIEQVRVANCGELVLQMKPKAKKRRHESESESASSSESSSDSSSSASKSDTEKKKKKSKKKKKKSKKKKEKKKKKKKKESNNDAESEAKQNLVPVSSVRPEELPEVPPPRFLYRGNPQLPDKPKNSPVRGEPRRKYPDSHYRSRGTKYSSTGRKIKGRGSFRFRSRSRDGSITPPHWRRELDKIRQVDNSAKAVTTAKDNANSSRWLKGDKLDSTGKEVNNTRWVKGDTLESSRNHEKSSDPESRRVHNQGKDKDKEAEEWKKDSRRSSSRDRRNRKRDQSKDQLSRDRDRDKDRQRERESDRSKRHQSTEKVSESKRSHSPLEKDCTKDSSHSHHEVGPTETLKSSKSTEDSRDSHKDDAKKHKEKKHKKHKKHKRGGKSPKDRESRSKSRTRKNASDSEEEVHSVKARSEENHESKSNKNDGEISGKRSKPSKLRSHGQKTEENRSRHSNWSSQQTDHSEKHNSRYQHSTRRTSRSSSKSPHTDIRYQNKGRRRSRSHSKSRLSRDRRSWSKSAQPSRSHKSHSVDRSHKNRSTSKSRPRSNSPDHYKGNRTSRRSQRQHSSSSSSSSPSHRNRSLSRHQNNRKYSHSSSSGGHHSPPRRRSNVAEKRQKLFSRDALQHQLLTFQRMEREKSESPPPTHWKPGQKPWRPKSTSTENLLTDSLSPNKALPKTDDDIDSDAEQKDSGRAVTPKSPKNSLSPELPSLPQFPATAPVVVTTSEPTNVSSSGKIQYNLEDQPEPLVAAVIKPDDRGQLNSTVSNMSNSSGISDSDVDSDRGGSQVRRTPLESKSSKSKHYSRQSTSGADKKPKEKLEKFKWQPPPDPEDVDPEDEMNLQNIQLPPEVNPPLSIRLPSEASRDAVHLSGTTTTLGLTSTTPPVTTATITTTTTASNTTATSTTTSTPPPPLPPPPLAIAEQTAIESTAQFAKSNSAALLANIPTPPDPVGGLKSVPLPPSSTNIVASVSTDSLTAIPPMPDKCVQNIFSSTLKLSDTNSYVLAKAVIPSAGVPASSEKDQKPVVGEALIPTKTDEITKESIQLSDVPVPLPSDTKAGDLKMQPPSISEISKAVVEKDYVEKGLKKESVDIMSISAKCTEDNEKQYSSSKQSYTRDSSPSPKKSSSRRRTSHNSSKSRSRSRSPKSYFRSPSRNSPVRSGRWNHSPTSYSLNRYSRSSSSLGIRSSRKYTSPRSSRPSYMRTSNYSPPRWKQRRSTRSRSRGPPYRHRSSVSSSSTSKYKRSTSRDTSKNRRRRDSPRRSNSRRRSSHSRSRSSSHRRSYSRSSSRNQQRRNTRDRRSSSSNRQRRRSSRRRLSDRKRKSSSSSRSWSSSD